jgi:ketosteroid isomerase-like protein
MSEENVEIVRRAHEALNAGNIDELVSLCHQDFQLDMSDRVLNPATYEGHDGIRQFYSEFRTCGSATSGNRKKCVTRETPSWPCYEPRAGAGEVVLRSTARRR